MSSFKKGLLKLEQIPAFRQYLEGMSIPVRDGKGAFQVLQVQVTETGWAVIARDNRDTLSSDPLLSGLIASFKVQNLKPAQTVKAQIQTEDLEILRDDFAMAALQGMLANSGVLAPQVSGGGGCGGPAIGPKTPELAAREAYRFADAMMEARKVQP
ncbi:hypothetical protein [Agrobacterium tumefaciens]|uniref:hypothetical protein n=1 Tax=Agrobacterium tumefaciens TaxID=358 RepID=UPI00157338D3|nr:hypothetical protein [Agrobacterium tumefaciens]